MAYLNKVMLIGNIGKDPEIRMGQNGGRKRVSFSLATSRRYRDNNGEFRAEIENIKPNGHMILKREDGTLSEYAFKEVTFI